MKLLDASLSVRAAAAEDRLIARLQVQLLDLHARAGEHLAERHAVDVREDRNLALAVVALDLAGPRSLVRRATSLTLTTRPGPAGTSRSPMTAGLFRILLVEPETHDELVVAVLELGHLLAADQRPQVGGERIDVDAKVGRADAIDVDPQLRLRRLRSWSTASTTPLTVRSFSTSCVV